jgi:hypothetical protein
MSPPRARRSLPLPLIAGVHVVALLLALSLPRRKPPGGAGF